jgi:hypothetical protein
MAKTVTLASMVSKVRSYADLITNDFRTDAQITPFIQARAERLWEELAKAGVWFLTSGTVPTVAGTSSVAVPADALQVVAVDLQEGSEWLQLDEARFEERYAFGTQGQPVAWFLADQGIQLLPTPGAVYSIAIWYVPTLGTLSDAAPPANNQLDSVNGWDEYVCWGAAADLKALQELDPSYQMARANEELRRVVRMARQRIPQARRLRKRRYANTSRRAFFVR